MHNPLFSAQIRETGERIQVYRHYTGIWIDYKDCSTGYISEQLILPKEALEYNGEN